MEQRDYWEKFIKSGKIDDYLKYAGVLTDSTKREEIFYDSNQTNTDESDKVS